MCNEHWQAFAPNLATSASYRRCSILSRRIRLTDLVDVSSIATQHRKGLPSPKYPVIAHYDHEDAYFASKGAGIKVSGGCSVCGYESELQRAEAVDEQHDGGYVEVWTREAR